MKRYSIWLYLYLLRLQKNFLFTYFHSFCCLSRFYGLFLLFLAEGYSQIIQRCWFEYKIVAFIVIYQLVVHISVILLFVTFGGRIYSNEFDCCFQF